MKPLNHRFTSALMLLILLSTAQLASAFYDPSLGRWLNRDPVEEIAFQNQTKRHRSADYFNGNLHWGMQNNPINKLDRWGLEIAFVGCGVQEQQDIRNALSDYCDRAIICAGCSQGAGGVNTICSDDPRFIIHCQDEDWVHPINGGGCGVGDCALGTPGLPIIDLCPDAFDPSSTCGATLGCILLHEAMHAGGDRVGEGGEHSFEIQNFDQCMGCR